MVESERDSTYCFGAEGRDREEASRRKKGEEKVFEKNPKKKDENQKSSPSLTK